MVIAVQLASNGVLKALTYRFCRYSLIWIYEIRGKP